MNHADSLVSKDFIRRHFGVPLFPYALGVSLFIGGIAFADQASRSAVPIVPKSVIDTSIAEGQPESFESYQIRILRNQNYLQTEKIKALREELAEVTQKMHELKPHLFTQGDPADQAKISSLAEKLKEKEELANQLSIAKISLEQEFSSARKKLTEMETVKEALTAMIEKQRLAKEQTNADFKSQIDELRAKAASEKSDLLKTIRQHEASLERLQSSVAAKTQDLSRLDDVATKLSAALASKHEELLALDARLLALYQEMQLMSANLDQQQQENRELKEFREEMKWIADLFQGSQEILHAGIDHVTANLNEERAKRHELAQLKSDLEAQYAKQAEDLNASESARQDISNKIQALSASLEAQQQRTAELEQELATLLSHQEAGQAYAEHIQKLVDHLSQAREVQEEHHAATAGALLYQLESATAALDQQIDDNNQRKIREAGLRSALQEAYAAHAAQQQALEEHLAAHKQAAEEHVAETGALLHHLSGTESLLEKKREEFGLARQDWLAKEAEFKNALQDMQAKLLSHEETSEQRLFQTGALLQHLDAAALALDAKSDEFGFAKQNWQAQETTLRDALREAYARFEQTIDENVRLSGDLQTSEANAQGMEDQLALRHYELMAQEGRALEMQAYHEASIRSLESQLSELNETLNVEAHRSAYLEALLQDAATLAQNNANTVEEYNSLFSQQIAEVDQMHQSHTGAVESLERRITGLRDNLETQTGLTRHLALEVNRKNEELNERLREREMELSDKQAALDETQHKLEEIKAELSARLEEITRNLEIERSQANDLKDRIEQMGLEQEKAEQHKQELEALVRDMSRDLSEKQQMLALTEDKATTTDYDNQALDKQNRELQQENQAARASHLETLDLLHTHAADLHSVRQQLAIAQEAVNVMSTAGQQLSDLKAVLDSKQARIATLESALAKLQNENEEQVRKLEQALADEKNLRSLAERDLQYVKMNYTAERRSLQNLEQIARESMHKNAALEKALSEAHRQLSDQENHVGLLNQDKQGYEQDLMALSQKLEEVLEREKSLHEQFQKDMMEANQQHQSHVAALEMQLDSFGDAAAKHGELHREYAEKVAFIEDLKQQMQILEDNLRQAQQKMDSSEASSVNAEERLSKAKEQNLELLSENQRLLRQKNQLELMLMEKNADQNEAAEDAEDDGMSQSRIRRVYNMKSKTGSEE